MPENSKPKQVGTLGTFLIKDSWIKCIPHEYSLKALSHLRFCILDQILDGKTDEEDGTTANANKLLAASEEGQGNKNKTY